MSLRSSSFQRLCLVLPLFCGLYYLCRYSERSHLKMSPHSLRDFKYILTWSDAYNDPLYGWPHTQEDGFELAGCEESRCHLTSNRSYLGTAYHVLFSVQSC